jgi:hypothetical protein
VQKSSAVQLSAARSNLDSMIVEIELTLISIIQGVALTFLIESTREVIAAPQAMFWPYVVAGLLVIFVFWSRSVLHIITVIRWPLEFGHNFFYIACALIEALLFTRLGHPRAWFAFAALFAGVGWALFVYDLRLIRARSRDSKGPASIRLCELVRRDQWLNIGVLLPAVFLLNLACALAIHAWPDFFVARHGHVWLVMVQLAGFSGYLFYVVRFYAKIAPFIVEARAEWQEPVHQPIKT